MYSCVCAKKAERETDIPTAGICRQSSLVMARKVFPSVYTFTWNKLHQVNWMFAPMLIMRNKLVSNINISCINKKRKPCMHVTQKGNKLGRGYWLFSFLFCHERTTKRKCHYILMIQQIKLLAFLMIICFLKHTNMNLPHMQHSDEINSPAECHSSPTAYVETVKVCWSIHQHQLHLAVKGLYNLRKLEVLILT